MPAKEVVTEELFLDWVEHPVTQAVRRVQDADRPPDDLFGAIAE